MSGRTVTFVVPGRPRGKQVARVTRRGNYMPDQTTDEMEAIGWIASAAMEGRAPFPGPVELRFCAWVPVPASWSKRMREKALSHNALPVARPDGSNYQKLLEDGLNGIVWIDDSQVVNWFGFKRFSADPRLVVTVTELEYVGEVA
jgi:Holliday junction resolvase RusA-like endonuclease